ncbi:roadblock/LC7 domain-containing protein [Croceicoccus gelatinilyticus]|uniref:roadblock/LC7 domain-containing protein n=1 Tax=Croceicoccus gelatinilyticus TaxID=2835536 RepID=UPI001BCEE376|nr:roadblock/LC7 domain-containing protein [Croceicoccus gelatinilyticus]MBS7670497.1 roadblock/LC7 domain-containing protein [Croceicoccus gelatinilyticus]
MTEQVGAQPVSAHKDPVVIAFANEVLDGFSDVCRSLRYATFLTDDGFEVASIAGDEKQNRRVASMASSMQALGDAVAKDLRIGGAEYIIIAAETGYVIQMRVPEHAMVLAAHFDAAETVGKALSVARLAASNMRTLVQEKAA